MSCKCSICGQNEVLYEGGICELCAVGQDPYAAGTKRPVRISPLADSGMSQANAPVRRSTSRKVLLNGGTNAANTDPYGNEISVADQDSGVQVYSAGQVPVTGSQNSVAPCAPSTPVASTGKGPITSGITKNVSTDKENRSILARWFRALFSGAPFSFDNEVTMFQVFPDFSGTALNAMGNACDQVVVYGKLNNGMVSENSDVEVYGVRDRNNNVIARRIVSRASGTTISPSRVIGAGFIRLLSLVAIVLVAAVILKLGIEGLIWAAVIILCFTNLPLVLKILGAVISFIFSLLKRIF